MCFCYLFHICLHKQFCNNVTPYFFALIFLKSLFRSYSSVTFHMFLLCSFLATISAYSFMQPVPWNLTPSYHHDQFCGMATLLLLHTLLLLLYDMYTPYLFTQAAHSEVCEVEPIYSIPFFTPPLFVIVILHIPFKLAKGTNQEIKYFKTLLSVLFYTVQGR